MPAKPRTDSLEHLVQDLRRDHPRLVLLVGEAHNSVPCRKHISHLLKGSQLGFWERPNTSGSDMGSLYSRQHFQKRLRDDEDASPAQRQNLINRTIPPYTAHIDMPNVLSGKVAQRAKKALSRLRHDGAPEGDDLVEQISVIHDETRKQRIEESNKAMATAMVNRLGSMFPNPSKRFYAVGVFGADHLAALPELNLTGTEADMKHTLEAAGYSVATIVFKSRRLEKTSYHRDGYEIKHCNVPGVDYQVNFFDPYMFRSASQRA